MMCRQLHMPVLSAGNAPMETAEPFIDCDAGTVEDSMSVTEEEQEEQAEELEEIFPTAKETPDSRPNEEVTMQNFVSCVDHHR